MKIVTITGINLQFDIQTTFTSDQIDESHIIDYLNKILSENALQPKLLLTETSKVIMINPIVLPEN